MDKHWREMLWERVRASDEVQKDIAEAIGVNQSTLSRWLNGEAEPKWKKHVRGLARYLDINEDQLWEQITSSYPPKVRGADTLTGNDKIAKIVALGALALDYLERSDTPPDRYADVLESMADIARWLVRAGVPVQDADSVLVTLKEYVRDSGALPKSLADFRREPASARSGRSDLSSDADGVTADNGQSASSAGGPLNTHE